MASLILIWAVQACLILRWTLNRAALPEPQAQLILYIFFTIFIGIGAYCPRKGKIFEDKSLLVTDGVVTFLWLCSLWQMTLYPSRPWLAQGAYFVLMALAIILKLFWIPLKLQAKKTFAAVTAWASTPRGRWWVDILPAIFIFLVIFIPDPESVVGWFYFGEQFHQWDGNFMGVDLGLFHGLLPDVDIMSTYGFGLPVFIAGWMKLFGGLSYVNAVKGLFWTGIIYYVLWYFLLRQWYKSALLALAAIALGLRMQMFDQAVVPMTWVQAPASIVRYVFDIFFFWALYGHIKTQRKIFLGLAAVAASLGMWHMMSTGTVLLVTLVCYVCMHLVIPAIRPHLFKSWRDYLIVAGMVAAVPLLLLFWTWLVVKNHAFTHTFWSNVTEYNNFFYNNVTTQRVTEALGRKEFLYMAVGLLFPVLYIGSTLYASTLLYFRKAEHNFVFPAILGLYGFFLHAYYILVATKYSTVGLPAVFLAFFWADYIAVNRFPQWQGKLRWSLLGVSLFCLLTAHMFTGYPNLLNFSRNPIIDPLVAQRVGRDSPYFNQLYVDFPESLKLPVNSLGERDEGLKFERDFKTDKEMMDYYYKDTDFSKDVQLIQSLTTPDERVPLLSSFEVLMLMEADRRPFFYYFPFLNSHPMRMRNFMVTLVISKDELARLIADMEREKPKYLFMERIFLTPQVPSWYGYDFDDLIIMLRYVFSRYEPVQAGQYLVAMKRRV
jgi:hypothetical protein